MLNYLFHHSLSLAGLWLTIAGLELLVLSRLFLSKTHHIYPAFALYVTFTALKTWTLLWVPPGEGFQIYGWINFSAGIVQCLLIALAVAELYQKVMGPRLSLPEWIPQEIGVRLAITITLIAVLGVMLRPRYGTPAMHVVMTIEEALVAALALALLVLIFYTGMVGIPLWPRDAHLATGFVLMLTTNAVTLLLVLTGTKSTVFFAQRAGQLAVIAAFGFWSWKLWEKEPILEKATDDLLRAVTEFHRETMEAERRLRPGQ